MTESGIRLIVLLTSIRKSITEKPNVCKKRRRLGQELHRSPGEEHPGSKDKLMHSPGVGRARHAGGATRRPFWLQRSDVGRRLRLRPRPRARTAERSEATSGLLSATGAPEGLGQGHRDELNGVPQVMLLS